MAPAGLQRSDRRFKRTAEYKSESSKTVVSITFPGISGSVGSGASVMRIFAVTIG